MKQKKSFMYIASFMMLTIPPTGRFVYGLTLILELLLLEISGLLLNLLVTKLKLNEIRSYFVMMYITAITIFFRQFLIMTYTEIALTLGFVLFLPPVSVFLTHTIFSDFEGSFSERFKNIILNTLGFSFFILIFFLLRDVAGYGTFTFFGSNHRIYEKILFNPERVGIFTFFASIPGALVLTSLVIYLFLIVRNKTRIISSRGESK